MLPPTAANPAPGRSRARRAASLLAALALSCASVVYYSTDDDLALRRFSDAQRPRARRRRPPTRRSLQVAGAAYDARALAKNGANPADVIPGEYIVKPWVGTANTDVWEDKIETKIELESAQSSTELSETYLPRNAIDDPSLLTRWASDPASDEDYEWINIDMGGPQNVQEIYIKWYDAYAVDFDIFVSRERLNCRSNGKSCPDAWYQVVSVTGKSDATPTSNGFEDDDHSLQGVKYVRLKMKKKATGFNYFSIFYIRVYRRPLIVGEEPTGISCGATTAAAASSLLGTHGGALIQTYDTAEFFAASMTEAQKDAMLDDPCVFTVEPNYVVTARGRGGRQVRRKRQAEDAMEPNEGHNRRLAIPEFNLKDEAPQNWGLERISSHGKLNGKYTWIGEGRDVDVYVFDTGIYEDHSEFLSREGIENEDIYRIGSGLVCAGGAGDGTLTNHGTHVASIAAGYEVGVAKAATIHPIQVLDANDEGTTASLLCGMEALLLEGEAYNAANAPKKIRGVVLLSLGVNGRSDALDKAVHDMTSVGFTVVIAAGDQDDNACFYSPHHESAITVGALSNDPEFGKNDKTATSNYGECIDLWAPGEGINGASNTAEYDVVEMSGTSVAAAFAAGAAALFFEEVYTEETESAEFAATVKDKVMNKAEINILGNIGHMSPNKNLQTTAVRCLVPSHCAPGLTCLFDGVCWDTSKPLPRPNIA